MRSKRKGPFIDRKLLERIGKMARSGNKTPVKTWSRASMVMPEFIGFTVAVHNGRTFTNVYVTENMVGHRLGEFAPTRTFRGHGAHTEKTRDKT